MGKVFGVICGLILLFSPVFCGADFTSLVGKHVWVCSSLATDIAAIGATETTLVVKDTQTLASSVEVPSTVVLRFESGGSIVLGNYNLTVNGTIDAGRYQIFTCAGSGVVSFATNYTMTTYYPEWWGAVADASTDSSTAIQQTIDAAETNSGGIIAFAKGTYVVSTGLTVTAGLSLLGAGNDTTYITSATAGIHILSINTDDAIVLRDMKIGYSVEPDTGKSCVYVSGTTSNKFSFFSNLYLVNGYYNIHMYKAAYYTIQSVHSSYSYNSGFYIENQYNGDEGDSLITGCVFTGHEGSVAAINYNSSGGLKIIGNKILPSEFEYGIRIYATSHGESAGLNTWIISGNSIDINPPAYSATSGWDIYVVDNTAIPNNGTIVGNAIGTIFLNGSEAARLYYIVITGNRIGTTRTGQTAVVRVNEAQNCTIAGNNIKAGGSATYGIEVVSGSNIYASSNSFPGFTAANAISGTVVTDEYSDFTCRGAELNVGNSDAATYIDVESNGTASVRLRDTGVTKAKYMYYSGNTYSDYTGVLYYRNPVDSTSRMTLDASGNLSVTGNTASAGTTTSVGHIYSGADDTTRGIIEAYGPSSGAYGGSLVLYLSDAHDTGSLESWYIYPYEDDLLFTNDDNYYMKLFGDSGNLFVYGSVSGCDVIDRGTCDFVFEAGYKLPTIDEVKASITTTNKLPGLKQPDVISMKDLMIKTEEQALYIIQLHERLEALEAKLAK